MRELSLGYDLVLDETPGEWNGQPYDAIQTGIVINHLAIVREARAGEEARLNIDGKDNENNQTDTQGGTDNMENANAKKDGENTIAENIKENSGNPPAGEKTIGERVQLIKDGRARRDTGGDPADVESAKGVIADQDGDIQKLLEIIEELRAENDFNQAKQADGGDSEPAAAKDGKEPPKTEPAMNADGIEAIVEKRLNEKLELIEVGNKLNLDGLRSLSPLEAKIRIIKAVTPSLRLDGESELYIDASFKRALVDINSRKDTDYQRAQMFNRDTKDYASANKSKSQQARDEMVARAQNGGKK
jgi:hypothetical protein